jgi:riboflavin synthase
LFTGIVEEIGVIRSISRQGNGIELTIQAAKVLEDIRLGDSISVNGICLTTTHYDKHHFTVDVVPETMRRSSLSHCTVGTLVNLERAMGATSRFGGHLVSGHIDDTGTITKRTKEDNAILFYIKPNDSSLLRYVIEKGSITIDGISLTVMGLEDESFSVSIIPHTLEQTILKDKFTGAIVNLEFDLIGKYIEKFFIQQQQRSGSGRQTRLTENFLKENGFL